MNKTGLRDFSTKGNVAGTEVSWETDVEGLVQAIHTADPATPANILTTSFTYDGARSLQTTKSPLLTPSFTSDVFGHVTTVVDTPVHPASTSDTVRSKCFDYDPYGEVTTLITPEGDAIGYSYDAGGHLIEVSMGPKPGRPRNFRTQVCAAKTTALPNPTTNVPSPREVTAQFSYNTMGQLIGSVRGGVQASYSYDGLNRLIDLAVTTGRFRGRSSATHYSSGYTGSRLAWSIAANFTAGEKLPAYLTPGVQAGEEYAYDAIGRLTQVKRWQFTASPTPVADAVPYAITEIAYDDVENSTQITDPAGVLSYTRLDGADRPLLTVLAKGDPAQVSTSYSYSGAGLTVTSTISPAPTPTGTFTNVQTFVPSGGLIGFASQGEAKLTRVLDSYGRIASESRPENQLTQFTYDAF